MLPDQISLPLSAYSELYDKLIPPTNRLRQIKDLVDFSFVYRALAPCYSHVNGRVAVNPILAFKYLLLKVIFDLSDVDVVDRSRYDLSFKYFLDLSPEADVINPSTLSRFRRQRLKDQSPLELLVGQTVHLAGERGLLADRAVILDATHTLSRYTASSAKVALEGRYRRLLSTLRDSVALTGEGLPVPLPGDSAGETLEEVRARCLALVKLTRSLPVTSSLPRVNERLNVLEETLQDVKRSGVISRDRDARVGHKSRHKSFFGYKTHVAMTKNGIITGVEVTTGEKADGQYLQSLVEQSRRNGVEVETVIADTAYSGRDNIIYTSARGIRLVEVKPGAERDSRGNWLHVQQGRGNDGLSRRAPGHEGKIPARKGEQERATRVSLRRETMSRMSLAPGMLQGRSEKENLLGDGQVRGTRETKRIPGIRLFQGASQVQATG